MKFTNNTDKVINMKIDKIWKSILPKKNIQLPEQVGKRQPGLVEILERLEKVEEKLKIPSIPKKTKLELNKMTKDELNDYAVLIGLKEIKSSMLKSEMIENILKHQDEI